MSMNEEWVVYEEEKQTRKWVKMPKELFGIPLFEHATDYISILDNGEKVMVRKKDGFVFPNSGVSSTDKNHLATPEEIEKMRAEAKRKAEERRRKGLQDKAPFVPTKHTDLRLPQEDGNWVVSRRDVIGKWVPMPTNYLGKPVIEYWNCYITDLESGERVFVNKKTGKVTGGSVNPDRDKGHLVTSKELDFLRKDAVRKANKRKEGVEKPIKAKSVPIEQIVKDRYDEKVPWIVDLDSSKRNRWYPMPIDFKGKPTFESWDSYVTKLSDGRKVAISKRTNKEEGDSLTRSYTNKGSRKPKTQNSRVSSTPDSEVSVGLSLPFTTDASQLKGDLRK